MREWLGIFDIQQMVDVSKNRILSLEMLSIETNRARKNDSDSIREQIKTIRMNLADEVICNGIRFEMIYKEILKINSKDKNDLELFGEELADFKSKLESGMIKADFAHDMVSSLSARINGTFDEYLMKIEYCMKEVEALKLKAKDNQHDDILKAVMEKLTCRRKIVKGDK